MMVLEKSVVVRDLEIVLSIGVHDHEKQAPQRLLVSVEVFLFPQEDARDEVAATVDYDLICNFVRSLSREPHVELQETVARRVLEFTLSLPGVMRARVETRKPDIFDDCDYVGVTMTAQNSG